MSVYASRLIKDFQRMVDEHWKYVANAAEYGKVDCSGAFTYWYAQEGSKMYHGCNTMWRKWSTAKGKIGDIELVPGMAVYKHRFDGKEPEEYRNDGQGNFYHVGLYIGDNKVIEAKGTNYGVVVSKLSEWSYTSRLKDTIYEADDESQLTPAIAQGKVTTQSGSLNLRAEPTTNSRSITMIPKGEMIDILATDVGKEGWYKARYKINEGFVMSKYVTIVDSNNKRYIITLSVDDPAKASVFEDMGFTVTLTEAG